MLKYIYLNKDNMWYVSREKKAARNFLMTIILDYKTDIVCERHKFNTQNLDIWPI